MSGRASASRRSAPCSARFPGGTSSSLRAGSCGAWHPTPSWTWTSEGLPVGIAHRDAPCGRAAFRAAKLLGEFFRALLRLEDKVAVIEQVDLAGRELVALVRENGIPFEGVGVLVGIARGRTRARHAELVAEVDEKRVLVRPFGRARGGPLGDELGNRHQGLPMLRVLSTEPKRFVPSVARRPRRLPPDELPRRAGGLARARRDGEGPAPSYAAC